MEDINWSKYGFKEWIPDEGFYYRDDFPLNLREDNGFLTVRLVETETFAGHIDISKDKIVANNQAVVLLLKAFNCPKLL